MSILLNILDVPGKNSDRDRMTRRFKQLVKDRVTLVIPIAAVIEVGNHLAQLPDGGVRRDRTALFAGFLHKSLESTVPWVVSGASWDVDFLRGLLDGDSRRPGLVGLCTAGVGAGDASILLELQRYQARSDLPSKLPVTLWTLDQGLAAYT